MPGCRFSEVAFCEDQLSVTVCPNNTEVGVAAKFTFGRQFLLPCPQLPVAPFWASASPGRVRQHESSTKPGSTKVENFLWPSRMRMESMGSFFLFESILK